MTELRAPASKSIQPLDRLAIFVMAILTVAIALLLLWGDRSVPRVREFNWAGKDIGASDRAFILTFSRPMDRPSVEENLRIDPPLPGKISWAGRRMAYTLTVAPPYGSKFDLQLSGARDRFSQTQTDDADDIALIEPFQSSFQTRDRAFAYLGTGEEELGQLVLYNLTQNQKTVLTPKDLTVMDFQVYPDASKILFSASPHGNGDPTQLNVQLYTVTTGIHYDLPDGKSSKEQPAGKLNRVLGNQEYQNLQFDLSPDGETIVVQRVDRDNPGGDFGLWLLREGGKPQKLPSQPGGEFLIAPSSQELAIAQGQGIALLPLDPDADTSEPLDFFPKFGRILAFTRDSSAAAMVKFNTDYTRSLYLVSNQGEQQELLRIEGSILNAEFDPNGDRVYCLLTELLEGEEYREQPYLAAIDLDTQEITPLLRFSPGQLDIQMSLAPDGLALLFDRIESEPTNAPRRTNAPRTSSGEIIASGQLWLLPIVSEGEFTGDRIKPESLPLAGYRPQWLP
jgi:dipeptidyl aminopeptidase/acylaminoacyl peptidase